MRTVGVLMVVAGILGGIILGLAPAKVTVLGTSISCGPPLFQLLTPDTSAGEDPFTGSIMQQCRSDSFVRCIIGLSVFAVATGGGAIMLVLGSGRTPKAAWAWDGYRWVPR